MSAHICPDCGEPITDCDAKANVPGSCWRWNAASGRYQAVPVGTAQILERKAGEAAEKEAAAPNEAEATYYNGMVEAFREAARIVREATRGA